MAESVDKRAWCYVRQCYTSKRLSLTQRYTVHRIPPPNSSSSFEVSAILTEHNFGDIRVYSKRCDYTGLFHCLDQSFAETKD